MRKILINDTVAIELSTLIVTRLLVQANSGAFGTYLSLLRCNGLIEMTEAFVKTNNNLFMVSAIRQARE